MDKRTFLKLSSTAITGAILSPMRGWSQETQITNWAGNYVYSTSHLAYAESHDEVVSLVKKYDRLKVLGTRHCFNGIADSRDQLISLTRMNPVMEIDSAARRVTVGAGVRYGQLAEYLNSYGFALHNLASLPHISVAGACATATHGSGNKNGNLATAVAEMEMITASGELIVLSREKNPDEFPGVVVHLGGLGVITRLKLDIQPTYKVSQTVYENLRMDELAHHFDEIMAAGYSVSLFTDWRNRNFSEVWVKQRWSGDIAPKSASSFFGATAATRNLHPIVELSAENCTPQLGVPGPWHERLPHFKMGFTPSSGKELQSEYFVPRDQAYQSILAVERLHEKVSPYLMITEIRTIDADNYWLSPCYKQPSATIHFTWKPEWEAVSKLLPMIEEQLAPFQARPHWGKLFTMSPGKLKSLYDKMPDFHRLAARFDPGGKFRNSYLDRNIFGT